MSILTVEEGVQQLLQADTTIMAILTGGIWITREPMTDLAAVRGDGGQGDLLPLAVVAPYSNVPDQNSWMANVAGISEYQFAVYLFQAGPAYDVINAALPNIFRILRNGIGAPTYRLPDTTTHICNRPTRLGDTLAGVLGQMGSASMITTKWQSKLRRIPGA